jgi:LCP family protein required for cell wall assembly
MRRESSARRPFGLLAGVLALLLLATAGFGARQVRTAAAQDDGALFAGVEPAALESLTVVVGGLDTRTPDEPENTDVLLIARVDLANRTVRAVSIPRDLYVLIPGVGYDKITRAYDYGSQPAGDDPAAGMALMRATIEENFGIATDAVVLTTFQGFVAIVDAVGGIDLDNPYDVYDAQYPTFDYGYKEIYYPAGPLHLSGEEALEFARTRHQDGDDGRVMRQQLVLRALLERVTDPAIAADLPALVAAARDAVYTDLTVDQMLALALAAPGFSNDGVVFGTITPYLWAGSDPYGAWIYQGDWSQLPGLVQGFLDGVIGL